MEMNLKELFQVILRKWWIILICTIICAGAAYVLTTYYMVPMYQADTTLYVGKNADEQGANINDLNIGASVVLDYREIAQSRLVASTVINELGLADYYSVDGLAASISVEQKSETRIIVISFRSPDPQMAMNITNKVAEVFQQKITDIMRVENVQVIDKAELPLSPVSPNRSTNLMIGILLGLMIGTGIVLLREYLDNTIKTTEDVEKCTGLPVIGTIPVFQQNGKGK
jgi:capsular polysaccharide biosynthesis protein